MFKLLLALWVLAQPVWATTDEATRSDSLLVSAGKRLNVARIDPDSVHGGTIYLVTATTVSAISGPLTITTSTNGIVLTPNNGTVSVDADLAFTGPQAITTSSGALTLTPTTDVLISNGTGLVVGHTAQVTANGVVPELQVLGTTTTDVVILTAGWNNIGGRIVGVTSANATIGSFTVAGANENILSLYGMVDDGTDYGSEGARIAFLTDAVAALNDTPGRIVLYTTADGAASATERMRLTSGGIMIIGDGTLTSHANLTQGILLDQRGNDDGIMFFSSSDVAVPEMGQPSTAADFGKFDKSSAIGGGLAIEGRSDADATTGGRTLWLKATSGDATVDVTHTSSTIGIVDVFVRKYDGVSAATAPTGDDAMFTVSANGTTRMVLQGEGELHITNTTLVALDEIDDRAALRRIELGRSAGVIRSKWDERVRMDLPDLAAAGIMNADGSMYSLQAYLSLTAGAGWMNTTDIYELQDEMFRVRGEVAAVRMENVWLRGQIERMKNMPKFTAFNN